MRELVAGWFRLKVGAGELNEIEQDHLHAVNGF